MRYAIIGAGLAGLTLAYELRGLDPEATIDVFEAAERIGGKLFTVPFDSGPTDVGAEAFLYRRKDAVEFIESLGLKDSLVYPARRGSLVYSGGITRPMPHAGVMGIPASSAGLADLIGAEACQRIDAEHTREPITWSVGDDRLVGPLVRERYGDEIVDRVVSALLGGVYSATADDLGMRATLPQLAQAFDELAESSTPITLHAAITHVIDKQRRAAAAAQPGTPEPIFATFANGYQELYETLAERSQARIYVDAFVASITGSADAGYTVSGPGVDTATYDRLVVATPAPTAARLLAKVAPEASTQLKEIQLASSAVVAMKFDSANGLPDNSGILVAADEPGVHAKAFTLSSKKWPHIEARGGAVVRASFGRFGDDALVRAEEDLLVDYALDDLEKITGFDGRAAGLSEIFVQRWFGGIPRFAENHGQRVARIRADLEEIGGLGVVGAWAAGVGVPAIIADSRAMAARMAGA